MLECRVLSKWAIPFLQDKLQGICTGDLVVIACASGCGKSSISRQVCMKARDEGCLTVLYSLEDRQDTYPTEEARFAYMRNGKGAPDLRTFAIQNTHNPAQFTEERKLAYLNTKKTDNEGRPLLVIHESIAKGDWDINRLKATMTEEIEKGYKLFIIDHLDVLVRKNEYEDLRIAMNELWAFVAENNVAIITFSQLAKGCETLSPSADDLRGGMAKVYKATHIVTISKHEYGYYKPPFKFPDAKPTYVRLAKARDTSTGCAVCYFNHGYYLDDYLDVMVDSTGRYVDGMTRDKLQKWNAENN